MVRISVLFLMIMVAQSQASPPKAVGELILEFSSNKLLEFGFGEVASTLGVEDKQQVVIDKITGLGEQLNTMQSALTHSLATITKTIQGMKLAINVDSDMQQLQSHSNRINELFTDFLTYTDGTRFNPEALENLMSTIKSHDLSGVRHTLKSLYWLIISESASDSRPGLFKQLGRDMKINKDVTCNQTTSHQQQLYELYTAVLVTEIRGFALLSAAYKMTEIKKNESFEIEIRRAMIEYKMRSTAYTREIKPVLTEAQRDLVRGDPNEYIRGETYLELEGLFQAFVTTEQHLTDHYSCKSTCGAFRQTRLKNYHHKYARPCKGIVRDCFTEKHWGGMTTISVCQMNTFKRSARRYAWIEVDDRSTVYGNKSDTCDNLNRPEIEKRLLHKCDHCICECEETNAQSESIRSISLQGQISNIDANMVVTAVRLVSQDNMIQIQIKQGKLLPQGKVDNPSWKELDRYTYEPKNGGQFRSQVDSKFVLPKGLDVAFVSKNQRTMHLDDISLPANSVITGVRFSHPRFPSSESDYQPIILKVRSTEFNFTTGQLNLKKYRWISAADISSPSSDYKRARTELSMNDLDNPLKSKLNVVDSRPNQYIQFSMSSLKKDAGQSTVPFFDGQSVGTEPGFALSGIKLFHRGVPGSGGYLTLGVVGIDIAQFVNVQTPDRERRELEALETVPLR